MVLPSVGLHRDLLGCGLEKTTNASVRKNMKDKAHWTKHRASGPEG